MANNVTLYAELETYGRYGEGGQIRHIYATGHNAKYALYVLLEEIGAYINFDSIMEWEQDIEKEVTVEQIVDSLEESNGDGCDYILLLKNLTTGEVLIESDYSIEDEHYDESEYDFTWE